MGSTSLDLQIITPLLTTIGSFALFHYSQIYTLQKNKIDIIKAVLVKAKIELGRSALQTRNVVNIIKFILQSIFFISLSLYTYFYVQTINTSSSDTITVFITALQNYISWYIAVFTAGFFVFFLYFYY